jgi:hypothetical protein
MVVKERAAAIGTADCRAVGAEPGPQATARSPQATARSALRPDPTGWTAAGAVRQNVNFRRRQYVEGRHPNPLLSS